MLHTEFASPRLETAVQKPMSVDVEVPSNREFKRDFDPGKMGQKEYEHYGNNYGTGIND